MEPGVQTCEETLTLGSGSCRDSAWLLVQVLRQSGPGGAVRFRLSDPIAADVKPLDGPAGPDNRLYRPARLGRSLFARRRLGGARPDLGPVGGEGHMPLAATPDLAGAAPITGARRTVRGEFDFQMSVTRVHEDPRVTKPYTRRAMASRSTRSGTQVDADLEAGDVRLTMGGEPTFVSIDDMDGAEWNIDGLGPNKRRLAGELIRRLRGRFAPGGLLALRPGQMVSRRITAALGAGLLLAQGRRADLAGPEPDRRRRATISATTTPRRRFIASLGRATGRRRRVHRPGLRRRLVLPVERAAACRSTSIRWTRS